MSPCCVGRAGPGAAAGATLLCRARSAAAGLNLRPRRCGPWCCWGRDAGASSPSGPGLPRWLRHGKSPGVRSACARHSWQRARLQPSHLYAIWPTRKPPLSWQCGPPHTRAVPCLFWTRRNDWHHRCSVRASRLPRAAAAASPLGAGTPRLARSPGAGAGRLPLAAPGMPGPGLAVCESGGRPSCRAVSRPAARACSTRADADLARLLPPPASPSASSSERTTCMGGGGGPASPSCCATKRRKVVCTAGIGPSPG